MDELGQTVEKDLETGRLIGFYKQTDRHFARAFEPTYMIVAESVGPTLSILS